MQFPSIPSWDAMHPLIIHFPIVLLLLAPIPILLAAILRPPRNRAAMVVALAAMLLGTTSLFLAASSGEKAAELAERGGSVDAVLSAHEELASRTEIVFSALSLLFVAIFLWPKLRRSPETCTTSTIAPILFLGFYALGIAYLVSTAHAGGRLVHEFGVHAMIAQPEDASTSQSQPPTSPQERVE